MRPYGERKKRRPGGQEHWIFCLARNKQYKKFNNNDKLEIDRQDKKKQRNFARKSKIEYNG